MVKMLVSEKKHNIFITIFSRGAEQYGSGQCWNEFGNVGTCTNVL